MSMNYHLQTQNETLRFYNKFELQEIMRVDESETPNKEAPAYKDNYRKDSDNSPMHFYSSKPRADPSMGAMDWLVKECNLSEDNVRRLKD